MNLTIRDFCSILFTLLLINSAHAEQTIEIVTDPWPPYAYEENGKIVGTDVEVTVAVLKQMGITAKFKLLPWKRSLGLVKNNKADAILAVSFTEERDDFLNYPAEPVSEGITVFFKKHSNPISSIDLENPKQLNVGAILGYKYCDELDDSQLLQSATRVPTLEQSFKMLLLDRLDLAVSIELVGFYKAREMAVLDQITPVSNERFCPGGNFLAFAKKATYKTLAQNFSQQLIKFKTTEQYRTILKKYGYQ